MSESKTVLKTVLTGTSLLQFAGADDIGVMACVSMSRSLKGLIAEFICQVRHNIDRLLSFHLSPRRVGLGLQGVLQLFVTNHGSSLSASNPNSHAKGFTGCLHSLYQQVPQQIGMSIASKLAPMQLLWVIAAQADALMR